MQITSFSRSKYRDFDALGDDITLLLPGLYGVFDGATDPTKTIIDGITSGRFAAVTCAQSVCQLWSEKKLRPTDELLHQVNAELEKALLDNCVPKGNHHPQQWLWLGRSVKKSVSS